MRRLAVFLLAGVVTASLSAAAPAPPPALDAAVIQAMIDAAAPNGLIEPPAGRYKGHLRIDKPITLDGHGAVTIDADGTGSVIDILTSGASVMNMHLTGTGDNHDSEDSGVNVRGDNNLVRDNLIEDCLFGLNLQQAHNNILRRNIIRSKTLDLGMRGDGIKLWYANDNIVDRNEMRDSRDFVLWYSERNKVTGNTVTDSRYGLHTMFAAENVIEDNRFMHNSVGFSLMYDRDEIIRRNFIGHSVGAGGTCIALKEASAITIENNDIQYCAIGMNFDVSPYQPGSINKVSGNRVMYNDIAVGFLNDWHDNEFRDNEFKGNMTEVAVFGGGSAKRNLWLGNTWDTYEGFDRNHDGIGDTPFVLMGYAGRVWMDVPPTRFFKGTPLLEVLDFLDRLAPFSQPLVMLEDPKPRFTQKDRSP